MGKETVLLLIALEYIDYMTLYEKGTTEMTARDVDRQVKEMKKFARETSKSPEKAREFLYQTGMYTKTGNLKKQFR